MNSVISPANQEGQGDPQARGAWAVSGGLSPTERGGGSWEGSRPSFIPWHPLEGSFPWAFERVNGRHPVPPWCWPLRKCRPIPLSVSHSLFLPRAGAAASADWGGLIVRSREALPDDGLWPPPICLKRAARERVLTLSQNCRFRLEWMPKLQWVDPLSVIFFFLFFFFFFCFFFPSAGGQVRRSATEYTYISLAESVARYCSVSSHGSSPGCRRRHL